MKHWHVLKMRYRFLFIVGIIILLIPTIFINGQTIDELQNKITQRNDDISKLEAEIKEYQKQLNVIGGQKSSLNKSLKELDLNKKKLEASISLTENKIEKTNYKLQTLSSQIHTKQDSIDNNIDAMRENFRKINEYEQDSLIETLVSENGLSWVWHDIDSISTIHETILKATEELEKVRGELQNTKDETTLVKNELIDLKNELADEKKIIEQNTKEKKKLLTQTKNNESNYQKLLKDRLAKKDAFEKELRDYESQLRYILDPSKLPNGGVLSWPLQSVYITQKFGKTEAGKRLYANGSHNGVDFRASIGTPVLAMSGGTVAGIGDTDVQCAGVSFGKFVLIKYDNGLASTYGHLSLIKVSTGDKVSRGQIVGYSGNTGYSTGPHLHVSLYAKDAVDLKTLPSKSCPGRVLTQPIAPINAYLDPLYYLPTI